MASDRIDQRHQSCRRGAHPVCEGRDIEVDAFAPATRAFDVAARATADAIDAGLLRVTDPDDASITMWCAVHGVAEVLLMGFAADDDTATALIDRVIDTVLAGQGRALAEEA